MPAQRPASRRVPRRPCPSASLLQQRRGPGEHAAGSRPAALLACCRLTAQRLAVAPVVGFLYQPASLGALARPPHRGVQQLQQRGARRLAAVHCCIEGLVGIVVQIAAWQGRGGRGWRGEQRRRWGRGTSRGAQTPARAAAGRQVSPPCMPAPQRRLTPVRRRKGLHLAVDPLVQHAHQPDARRLELLASVPNLDGFLAAQHCRGVCKAWLREGETVAVSCGLPCNKNWWKCGEAAEGAGTRESGSGGSGGVTCNVVLAKVSSQQCTHGILGAEGPRRALPSPSTGRPLGPPPFPCP